MVAKGTSRYAARRLHPSVHLPSKTLWRGEKSWNVGGFRELVGAILVSAILAVPVAASDPVTATRSGMPIDLGQAARLSCHDLDYPVLRCFASPDAMLLDAQRRLHEGGSAVRAVAVLDVGYVVVYEHATYGGSSMLLSADQAWLSDIGWNDRISSFKSFGGTGNFREHSPGSGFSYTFSPSSQVSSLSGSYNDKFSAFNLN